MKIVYCIPDTFRPGGIERVLSIKASYLAEYNDGKSYDITIITTGQKNRNSYYSFSNKIHFIDLDINYDDALTLPIVQRFFVRYKKRSIHKKKLETLLKKISANIVISTFTHESAFLPSIKDGSKKILEFHFSLGYKIRQAEAEGSSLILKLAFRYLSFIEEHITAPKYDAFVVLTEEDKIKWERIVPQVTAIPNILPFNPKTTAELENPIALAIGRLNAQKGFDRLIHIWEMIKMECPNWKLHIIGSGTDKDKLTKQIKLAKLEEHIFIYPPERNITQRYTNSSLYVMTSRYEGFPMVLLEAMAFGLPCVSYTYPCGPSEIIIDNQDGFLIKEGDEKDFAKKTISLLKNQKLRKEMGKKAASNIQRYSCDTIMKIWIELFKQLT